MRIEMIGDFSYNNSHILGKGAFGIVYKAWKTNNPTEEVAIKRICNLNNSATKEMDILNILTDHNHIVRAYERIVDPMDLNYSFLIMEYIQGRDLLERVLTKKENEDEYTEKNARNILRTILETVQYMHSQNVVHRDLKVENIVLTKLDSDTDMKIVDFGSAAKFSNPSEIRGRAGTKIYRAPETYTQEVYSTQCDMWSIGVITYILLWAKFPFLQKTEYWEGRSPTIKFPNGWGVSDQAKQFVQKLLVRNPTKRMTISQALEHDWMKTSDQDLSLRKLHISIVALRCLQKWRAKAALSARKASSTTADANTAIMTTTAQEVDLEEQTTVRRSTRVASDAIQEETTIDASEDSSPKPAKKRKLSHKSK